MAEFAPNKSFLSLPILEHNHDLDCPGAPLLRERLIEKITIWVPGPFGYFEAEIADLGWDFGPDDKIVERCDPVWKSNHLQGHFKYDVLDETFYVTTFELRDDPVEVIFMRALDVEPYRYGIWCTVAGQPDEPFVNQIVLRKWTPAGRITIMLDTHNFDEWGPDDLVQVVEIKNLRDYYVKRLDQERAEFLAARPLIAPAPAGPTNEPAALGDSCS